MAAALDTLQIVKRLKEAGFDEPQAEALTTVFRDLRETDLSLIATKADIQLLKTAIMADIERIEANIERIEAQLPSFATKIDLERLEAKLDVKISGLEVKVTEMKADIIRWVFGIAFAQAALILAVLKFFPGAHS